MLEEKVVALHRPDAPIQPLRGLGFWFAAVGLIIFARGVFEFWDARRRF